MGRRGKGGSAVKQTGKRMQKLRWLLLLARAAERKVSQEELMEALWSPDAHAESRALWTLISRLRKKLNSQESRLEISSLRGGDYLLEQL